MFAGAEMPGADFLQPGAKVEVFGPSGAELLTRHVPEGRVVEAYAHFNEFVASILKEFKLPHFSLSMTTTWHFYYSKKQNRRHSSWHEGTLERVQGPRLGGQSEI